MALTLHLEFDGARLTIPRLRKFWRGIGATLAAALTPEEGAALLEKLKAAAAAAQIETPAAESETPAEYVTLEKGRRKK